MRASMTPAPLVATLLTMAVLVAPGATAAFAAETPDIGYPRLSRVNVIRAQAGVSGIVFEVPESIRIYAGSMGISADEETRIAWAGVSQRAVRHWCDFCVFNATLYISITKPNEHVGKSRCTNNEGDDIGCPYDSGLLEVYFAADGPVTFRLVIPELTGTIELDATGEVDGLLKVIEPQSGPPTHDETFVFGGEAHEVGMAGRGGMGQAISYLHKPAHPVLGVGPGVGGVKVCAYPNWSSGGNPDPAAHPEGCDGMPQPSYSLGGATASGAADGNFKTHGQQYVGFRRYHKYLVTQTTFIVWGLWMTQDIACPSFDFHDCDKPPPGTQEV